MLCSALLCFALMVVMIVVRYMFTKLKQGSNGRNQNLVELKTKKGEGVAGTAAGSAMSERWSSIFFK
jgi:hypothetical protein